MTGKVTAQEIAQYRLTAKKLGLKTQHLTDEQVTRQIEILRGGIHKPTSSELKEIRARAKKTERVFARAQRQVLGILRKAERALRKLETGPSLRRLGSKGRTPSLRKVAETILELPGELLGTPPSLLGTELQRLLPKIHRMAARAREALEREDGAAERDIRKIARELREAIKKT